MVKHLSYFRYPACIPILKLVWTVNSCTPLEPLTKTSFLQDSVKARHDSPISSPLYQHIRKLSQWHKHKLVDVLLAASDLCNEAGNRCYLFVFWCQQGLWSAVLFVRPPACWYLPSSCSRISLLCTPSYCSGCLGQAATWWLEGSAHQMRNKGGTYPRYWGPLLVMHFYVRAPALSLLCKQTMPSHVSISFLRGTSQAEMEVKGYSSL